MGGHPEVGGGGQWVKWGGEIFELSVLAPK